MNLKKYFCFLLFLLMIGIFKPAYCAHQLYADREGAKIPYGTKLELKMSHDVTSAQVTQGDIFQAYLTKDIYINNKLVLPAKTIFRGRISQVKPSRRLSRPAKMYIKLDHLVTTTGMQLPIKSGISSDFNYILKEDGALTTNGNYFKALKRDVKNSGKIVKNSINWAEDTGDDLFTGAKYVLVPISAIGGSIACVSVSGFSTIADLFKKGDEVVLKKGAPFTIILLSTLDISL